MTSEETVSAARSLLLSATPLRGDCGTRCAAACCRPDEDGQGGMLLFPGEEPLYTPAPAWADVTQSGWTLLGAPLLLLTCRGACPRECRPLACRFFPLTPLLREGRARVEMDPRAWPLCPLMPSGTRGLAQSFVTAAQAAADVLCRDTRCRAYLQALAKRLEAYGEPL